MRGICGHCLLSVVAVAVVVSSTALDWVIGWEPVFGAVGVESGGVCPLIEYSFVSGVFL